MKPKGYIGNPEENVVEKKEEVSAADQDIMAKIKAHMENTSIHPNKAKRDEWDAKESVKGSKSKADAVQARLNEHANNLSIHVSKAEKAKYLDKYTRTETDNKIAAASMGITWKEPVDTYAEFQKKYEKKAAKEGDYVVIQKESRAFRYTGGAWRPVAFNIYPMAEEAVNGLMSASDKAKLNAIEEGANNYVHPADEFTNHVTNKQIIEWSNKADSNIVDYYHPGLMTPEMLRKLNAIITEDDEVKIARTIETPVVKQSINTVTIGPVGSSADFIYNKADGLEKLFKSILSNMSIHEIRILYNRDKYIVRSTIKITASNINISAEPGVEILNQIPYTPGSKQPRYTFELNTISNVAFTNIGFSAFGIDQSTDDSKGAEFGHIRIVGSTNIHIHNCAFNYGVGVWVNGYGNDIFDCKFNGCETGVYVRSNADMSVTNCAVSKSIFTLCITGVAVASYKTDCQYNRVADNTIHNCSVGIDICNDAISYEAVPSYNMIKDNIIYRGTGSPKDYKLDEYTIRVNGCDNIITTNLLRGKDVAVETFSKPNVIHNYVK